jgi:DNA-binding NtrC family response regulator
LVARVRAANMTLPVIVFSGSPELGDASDHPYLHLSAILQKSCEYRNLLDAVKRVLPLPQGEQHEVTLDSLESAEFGNHSTRAQFGRLAEGSTM